ncbi:CPBP family intramembrane glutamic endopeptidase [Nocardia testacea]|uniref:CPBP family intramembrane glutamic endopeptidase n=1 Tax=Nocardia testacea TaxID=248551 RepID=UPI001C3F3CED|nr:CPBP family intramembrane glutamic endopeptidase [Nocardia testacea]
MLLIAARGLDALVSDVPVLRFALGIGAAIGAIFAYTWLSRRVENRPAVTELAAAGRWRGLGRGALVGAGAFLATMLLAALFTDADVTGGSFGACLGMAGAMASVAVTEELLFRGVVHRVLEERTGSIVAIAVSSLIFGLAHSVNSNATLWGALAIAVEGGALLAIAYTATRSLWLPIGLHFAWNFTESGVFGTAVSGADGEPGLLRTILSGPVGRSVRKRASSRCCAAWSRRCGFSAGRSSSPCADLFISGPPRAGIAARIRWRFPGVRARGTRFSGSPASPAFRSDSRRRNVRERPGRGTRRLERHAKRNESGIWRPTIPALG